MKDQNIGVFVDVISIHGNLKKYYGGKLDYRKYLDRIEDEGHIYRAFAYGAQVAYEADKFVRFLRSVGFETKYLDVEHRKVFPGDIYRDMEKVFRLNPDDNVFNYLNGKSQEPAIIPSVQHTDVTMEMAMDIVRLAERFDTVVIGSSSPKLRPLIKYIKEKGCRVIVFSCNIPGPLKQETDVWWEIKDNYLEERVEEEKVEEEEQTEEEEEVVKNDYSIQKLT